MSECAFLWGGPHDGAPVPRLHTHEILYPREMPFSVLLNAVGQTGPELYMRYDRYVAAQFAYGDQRWTCYIFEPLLSWFVEAIPRQMNALLGLIEGWRWG